MSISKVISASGVPVAEDFGQSPDGTPIYIDLATGTAYFLNASGVVTAISGGSGGAAWGTITGTLSDQTDLQSALDAKQATLVSGTNIKTVNGSTLLGAGDLVVGITPVKTVGVTFDGGGSAPTAGTVGYIVAPFGGTISRWDVVADQSGSAVVDVWKAAGAIPTDANRIAGTEKPTLAAAQLGNDTSLTTWSTLTVTAGDVLGFELESVTTCTRVTVEVSINQS